MIRIAVFFFTVCLISSCEQEVREYNGFTQSELEYMLSGEELKAWNLIGREEGETEISLDDCATDNYLIFVQGTIGEPKPLLYAYNPNVCDSTDFCMHNPQFCQSDTALCAANPELCASLGEGVLYIGSWYVKAPFIENSPSDTLIFTINNHKESAYIPNINAENVTIRYRKRTGTNGEIMTEFYYFPLSTDK